MNEKITKKGILILTPFFSPNVGGVETHFDDLCDGLSSRGHKVFVITYQPLMTKVRGKKIEKRGNIEIHRISWFGNNWFNKLERYPIFECIYLFPGLFMYSFFFLLKKKKIIDVVHTQGFIASFVGKIIKLFFKTHFVASVHTVYDLDKKPFLGKIFCWILSSYDKILLVSEGARKELLQFGIDQKKVEIFTYWANQDKFRPLDKGVCKKQMGWENKFVALFVGRLIKIKGAKILIEAAKKTNKNINFAFIVTGKYEDFLKMVDQQILDTNIIYVGKVDYSVLNLYYSAADVLVVPSQYKEGFARVNLEAMLCGTPVIASNKGCLPEIINPNVGELVEPSTADEFAKRIEFYYNNKTRLKWLSDNCQKYAKERFSEKNIEIIEKSYQKNEN
jgi:glycosyltransferase involved in cell wall biosynthesis